MTSSIPLRIKRIETVALDVKLLTLHHRDDAPLPDWQAGAHIELELPNGLVRSYSLLNRPGETRHYQIAVHKSPTSAGGSRCVHEALSEGSELSAQAPRNHFPLHEEAGHSCLIAGGIGITPLMAMAQRLNQLGRRWELHYCVRTPEHAAFVRELQTLADEHGNHFVCHFDQVSDANPLDIAATVRTGNADTHWYCCGPTGMLEAFEQATKHCRDRAHVEYFGAKQEAALEGGYTIELARSGKTLHVPPGRSILDVVLAAGINVKTSCREGICGSCETGIIEGEADHRDALLTPEEQAENTTMMICCSGAKSGKLVLDL